MPLRRPRPVPPDAEAELAAALSEALSFPAARAADAAPATAELRERALEEAAFGRVAVDERGLTAGMRLHLIEPERRVLAAWAKARAGFDRLLAPLLPELRALNDIESEITARRAKHNQDVAGEERSLEGDTRFQQILGRREKAKARFELRSAENGHRAPNLSACHWSYLIAIGCIGVAEWLINYDTLLQFFDIRAIAVGATAILGLLLAFAADGHGKLLKQWSHRFGPHRVPSERATDRRLLAFSTFSLLLVLAAAGASRYEAVARVLSSQSGFNILGAEAAITVHPLRDVLLSLLANLAAWAVGVFVAYFAHDPDPDFMDAAHEWRKVEAAHLRRRLPIEREIRRLEAAVKKDIAALENRAKTHAGHAETERGLLSQVSEHERSILAAVFSSLAAAAGAYRDQLVGIAGETPGRLAFARSDGAALSPYEYQATPILIDPEFVRRLLPHVAPGAQR